MCEAAVRHGLLGLHTLILRTIVFIESVNCITHGDVRNLLMSIRSESREDSAPGRSVWRRIEIVVVVTTKIQMIGQWHLRKE